MSKTSGWVHRKADTDEERFGLLDKPSMMKYRRQPVFQEPVAEPKKSDLVALGFTSGVGSMLFGAQELGFQIAGNIEWRDYYRFRSDEKSKSTFPENFPGAFMSRGLNDTPKDLLPSSIDFLAGHPECGRFSELSHSVVNGDGAYKATRADDVSDIPMFIKAVATLRPRFFLMDDLPASFNPFPMQKYVDLLPDYDLFPEWISNFGYGNIQKHRNRMFVVGALKSEKFTFVPGEKNHDLVLKDIIGDLVGSAGDGSISNHATVDLDYAPGRYVNMRAYGERITWGELQKVFEDSRWSKNLKYYTPAGEEKNRPGTINPRWDGYCPVLSGGYNPLHPIRRLPLTVRERARIQGFPDSFIFYSDAEGPGRKIWEPYNSDGQRGVKQTGKAMPLQFCTFVADQVKHKIEGRDFEATGVRLLKPNALVSKAKLDFCEQSGYADQESACQACWLKDTCHIRRENQTTEKELSV